MAQQWALRPWSSGTGPPARMGGNGKLIRIAGNLAADLTVPTSVVYTYPVHGANRGEQGWTHSTTGPDRPPGNRWGDLRDRKGAREAKLVRFAATSVVCMREQQIHALSWWGLDRGNATSPTGQAVRVVIRSGRARWGSGRGILPCGERRRASLRTSRGGGVASHSLLIIHLHPPEFQLGIKSAEYHIFTHFRRNIRSLVRQVSRRRN